LGFRVLFTYGTKTDEDLGKRMDRQNFDTVFSHYQIQVNGVRLHYVMGSPCEPIVLLHGWPQTWYEWRRVMPLLRLVILDLLLPGFGLEEARASGFLWHHWFHMVDDIPEALTQGREELYLCAIAYRRDPYNPHTLSNEDIAEYLRCYSVMQEDREERLRDFLGE
jgi:pimeloyl-ACP methyl ester carboxylesterase